MTYVLNVSSSIPIMGVNFCMWGNYSRGQKGSCDIFVANVIPASN